MSEYGFSTEGKTIVSDFYFQVQGRTFLITGSSQGSIGSETTISLAHSHPSALILSRSLPKIQPATDSIQFISPSTAVHFIPTDLSSFTSVRTATQTIINDPTIPNIDIVINSAGLIACPYAATEDGFELQFATNHLSRFLLTNLLMPKIFIFPNPIIINVSSTAHLVSNILYYDPGFIGGKDYNPILAYAQSKTANALFSLKLNKRLGGEGLWSFSLHPGAVDTGLARYFTKEIMEERFRAWKGMGKEVPRRKTLEQGCAMTLRAVLDPGLVGKGVYLEDCQIAVSPECVTGYALDEENAARC